MSKKETSVFSLSLLDLLFCAFGGVIVLTVVFSAIIKYEQAQNEKPKDIAISLNVSFTNGNTISGLWKLQARNAFTTDSRLNSRRISKDVLSVLDSNWVYYSYLNDTIKGKYKKPQKKGSYKIGLTGRLKTIETGKIVTDTIYLMMEDTFISIDQIDPIWSTPSGEIIITGHIFSPGSLPKYIEFPPIPANALSDEKALPLVLRLDEESFSISPFNF